LLLVLLVLPLLPLLLLCVWWGDSHRHAQQYRQARTGLPAAASGMHGFMLHRPWQQLLLLTVLLVLRGQ
jgi:hypothetical protein